MDAVELGYPVDVPNFMGSEVFGGDRVTVNELGVEVEAATASACESNSRVSIIVNTSIDRCSTFLRQKVVTSSLGNLESTSCEGTPENELCKNESQPPNFQVEDLLEQLHFRGTSCPSSGQLPRKAGKMSRSISSSRCSKRTRLAHFEDNMSLAGVEDIKDLSDSLGPCHNTKWNTLGKSQMTKHKNNYSSKRGDKKSFKVPLKAKYDPFTIKAGLASSSSAPGGNNFFGVYGLKLDFLDITEHVDELSLKDLLDGTYESSYLATDKGKKTASWNDNFLHSIRKACSSLVPAKPAQPQNSADMDSSTSKKLFICPQSSFSLLPTDDSGDKGSSSITEQSLLEKESCSKPETPVDCRDIRLYQPKDILEKLALPPPKNLEALLLDAAKPSSSSQNNSDIRSGRKNFRGASLPPFSWSHTFNGHCKTNSDAVKLLTNRSTCQGRWARIPACTTSVRSSSNCFTNLESLVYDQSLVPVTSSFSHPWIDWGSSSLATCSKFSGDNLGSGNNLKNQVNVEHCPGVLAAARTLCDLATQSWRRNPDSITKWPKKLSQKAMKARKSKLFEKHKEVAKTQFPNMASEDLVISSTNQTTSSKRPKLSLIENRKDCNHIIGTRKGSVNWSTPRSNRSSPNKTGRDPDAQKLHATANILRQSCMMSPPAKAGDKSCSSQQKLRKLMPHAWDSGRDRID